MARVGAFAASPSGRVYATVCERFGLDPAQGFADDFVAFNLRAALIAAEPSATRYEGKEVEEPSTEEAWAQAGEANRQAWLAGALPG